jgi:pentatricopeptide repeat protein
MKNILFLVVLLFLFTKCKEKTTETTPQIQLGEVVFDVSGSEAATEQFHEGLLLLHSFEFEDAADRFVQAQQLDSTCVMAYWGEAMSYNHPLWRERYTDEGRAALEKLAATKEERLAKTKTPMERDFFEAVEILYSEGDKEDLDIAYRDQMEELHNKYPDHHEVSAFYALSLLGASKSRTADDGYDQGARIAQSIIDENPKHPGALHYLIHSYDDPDHAGLALEAANSYSQVAPDAGHALHMPSHIYVALGMWDQVISSNIASYEASITRMKEKELDNDALGYHSYKWLMYGYLQKGDFEKAKEMVYTMKKNCEAKPSSKARSHLIMMKGAYLTESGDWQDPLAEVKVDLDKVNLLVQGVEEYTHGMSAYHSEAAEPLKAAIETLAEMRSDAEKKMVVGAAKMCSGVSRYLQPPSVDEVNSLEVLELELKAALALLNKDEQSAEKWMLQATEVEENTTYTYGPPNIVKPSFEMYGEWLLAQNRKAEATVQFEKVLQRAPKRWLAMRGIGELGV